MKQLEVIVKDKNTLILSEDGEKGDLINLAELTNVDLTAIEEAIDTLVAMGLTRFDATAVVKNVATQEDTTEDIIKKSLKNLNK